jgi:deoxyribonuclease V
MARGDCASDMWNVTPDEAVELQEELRKRVRIEPLAGPVRLVAGCDIAYDKRSTGAYAGIVVLSLPSLEVVDYASEMAEMAFPYIPGLLSFRECPLLLNAWSRLKSVPDAVMLDGHGVAHPRRFGLASHFGVMVEKPSIGCAKTSYVGQFKDPGPTAGSYEYIVDNMEVVGAVLRTRDKTAPIYVSPGHMIDLDGSIDLALKCVRGFVVGMPRMGPPRRAAPTSGCANTAGDMISSSQPRGSRYRVPEPTRLANIFVNALRRGETGEDALGLACQQ